MKMKYQQTIFLKRILSAWMVVILMIGQVPLSVFGATEEEQNSRFASVGESRYGSTYYVDGENGSDSNSGKSPSSPWETLDKVTASEFLPGDHILLRASSVWNGQMLYPKGNGNSIHPIIVDLYELDGANQPVYSADTRPIINGNGTRGIGVKETIISGAVMLYNQEYWEIRNLEVTNSEDLSDPDAYKKAGTTQRAGILAYSDNQEQIYEHIIIKDCYVHDVQSEYYQRAQDPSVGGLKAVGGIIILGHQITPDGQLVAASRGKSTAGYRNVLIEGNIVKRVGLEGIRTKCNSDTSLSGNTFNKTFSDITIRNNYLEDIAGDGIVLSEIFEGGVVENNISKQACNADYGTHNYAGLWSMSSDHVVFQNNEVYGIVYGYNDGEAFDIDMACYDNVYQYNYSHHNTGGFFLLMGNQYDSILRYNISANDGAGSRGTGVDGGAGNSYNYKEQSIFHYWNQADNNTMPTIYNNTFYVGDGISTALYGEGNSSDNSGTRARFYNNILVKEGAGSLKFLTNYPTNGSTPTERKLGAEPEKFMKNNIIWPASIATERSGATRELLETGGNLFVNPELVLQEDFTHVEALAAQKDSQFDPSRDDIYEYSSVEALRTRASIFQLQSDSPALGKGMPMDFDLEYDFFGNSIEDVVPDIGAHQRSNIAYRTELISISDTETSTLAGIYPSLPSTITVELRDIMGSESSLRTETMGVIWDRIPLADYTHSGTFTVLGHLEGFVETATATVTVTGDVSENSYLWETFSDQDAFIQRNNGNTAFGSQPGSISYNISETELPKSPMHSSYTNNYVLKIKNASDASYNRRVLLSFDLSDFEEEKQTIKQASIRLHIARYDSWNGAGQTVEEQLKNTARILDVYGIDPEEWEESSLTWNNAPAENALITQTNHNGGGSNDNQIPAYETIVPISQKRYINRDIIANNHTIDIDITDYILQLDDSQTKVGFLVDIPYDPSYNKDNSGFDAFSKEGASAAYEAYLSGDMPEGITIESETSLAPQMVFSSLYEKGIIPIEVETKLGRAPVLPTDATLIYSDESTKTIGVRWDPIPAAKYREEGEFTVTGYSSITNIPIIAKVKVVADHIQSLTPFTTIYAEHNKARNELGLPNQCMALLENGELIQLTIASWDDSAPPYSPNQEPGEYDFTGVLQLPTGVTNPNNVIVSQKVITYSESTELTIRSVGGLEPIFVSIGTDLQNISFPEEVAVTLSDGGTLIRGVSGWTAESGYDPSIEGDYQFTGTIDVSASPVLANPDDLSVGIRVTVGQRATASDKRLLTIAIEEAEDHINDGTVSQLIPSVKESILSAYGAAVAIYENANASKSQVNQAKNLLMEALWNLGYIKADKTRLTALILEAEAVNSTLYTNESIVILNLALRHGRELAEDEELSVADQSVVDAGGDSLRMAIDGLVRKSGSNSRPSGGGSGGSNKVVPVKATFPSSIGNSNGWRQDSIGWWLETGSGSYAKNEWKLVNERWFFFDSSGYMVTGWRKLNNDNWYYLKEDGAMAMGWFMIGEIWYYLNTDGSMKIGWFESNHNWYYLSNSGAMLKNSVTPDGFAVNEHGVWMK